MSDEKHKCDIDAIVRAEWAAISVAIHVAGPPKSAALRCPECGATITFTFDGTITSRDDHAGKVTTMRVTTKEPR